MMNYPLTDEMQRTTYRCGECGKMSTAQEWDDHTSSVTEGDGASGIKPVAYGAGTKDVFYYCPKCNKEVWGEDID